LIPGGARLACGVKLKGKQIITVGDRLILKLFGRGIGPEV